MVSYSPTVVTLPHGGSLHGKVVAKGVRAFLGIPYATVVQRWRPARKFEPWKGERDAKHFGPKCPHPPNKFGGGPFVPDNLEMDEYKCLNLNVYVPEKASDTLLPVMVWIHGGALKYGTGAGEVYRPEYMINYAEHISHPVIVVNFNYRTNIFGFFASNEIAADVQADRTLSGDEKSVGNWGLLDQKLAFEWVKENIQAFGGNPESITSFGQSAGAVSTAYHLIIPSHKNLFQRAIIQSGSVQTLYARPISGQEKAFNDLLAYFEIPSYLPASEKVGQLHAISADKFAAAIDKINMTFHPFMDGVLIKEDTRETINNPDTWDAGVKEVMIGDCKDEGTLFPNLFGWTTMAAYNKYASSVPENLKHVFERFYPVPTTDSEVLSTVSNIFGDSFFGHLINKTAKILTRNGKRKVYYYHFDHDLEETKSWGAGIYHAIEIPFVFLRRPHLKDNEVKVAEKVVEFWVKFAYGEDLSGSGWPDYGESGSALVFTDDGQFLNENTPRKKEIYEFWEEMSKVNI